MSVRERNTVIYRSVYEQPQVVSPQMETDKKWEEVQMPFFSRDIPTGSQEKALGDTVKVAYDWPPEQGPSEFDVIKIRHILFRKELSLGNLCKINSRDGLDSFTLNYDNATYILRKTTEEIAKALLNASFKIKGAIESIAGYIATVLGNFYVISIVEKGSWVFDESLGSTQLSIAKADSLDGKQKERLVELSLGSLIQLHKQRLILGRFSLSNLLLTAKGLLFTDLRKMRLSKKSSFFAEEFIEAMRFLFNNGLATRADVTHAAILYSVDMGKECGIWYREQNGSSPDDEMKLVSALEKRIFS